MKWLKKYIIYSHVFENLNRISERFCFYRGKNSARRILSNFGSNNNFSLTLLPKSREVDGAFSKAVYSIQGGVTSILVLDLSIRRQIFLLLLRRKGGLLFCRLQNSSYPDWRKAASSIERKMESDRTKTILVCYSFTNSSSTYQT